MSITKKFETLEHKADLKIRAFGKTKEELFRHCLEAMTQSQKAKIKSQKVIKRTVKISALDLSALLVDFLSEVLYQSQVNKEIYYDAKFEKLTDTELTAEIFGKKAERFGEDIKAVTYHELDIHQNNNGGWETTVLFDI